MEEKTGNNPLIDSVTANVSVPDLGIEADSCITVKPNDPCTIVILGATGDLTARKLMPALFDLFQNSGLPRPFNIVGCGRTDWDDQTFRNQMEKALKIAQMESQRLQEQIDGMQSQAQSNAQKSIDRRPAASSSKEAGNLSVDFDIDEVLGNLDEKS